MLAEIVACTPEQSNCGRCGKQTTVIGYEETEVLDVRPAEYYVKVTRREKRACRDALRQERAPQLLQQLRAVARALQKTALPKSAAGQAANYTLSFWSKLTVFLKHPELELSTNLAENAMRSIAIGRKNWLHLGSKEAGPKIARHHFNAPVDTIKGTVVHADAQGVTLREYPGRVFHFSSVSSSMADLVAEQPDESIRPGPSPPGHNIFPLRAGGTGAGSLTRDSCARRRSCPGPAGSRNRCRTGKQAGAASLKRRLWSSSILCLSLGTMGADPRPSQPGSEWVVLSLLTHTRRHGAAPGITPYLPGGLPRTGRPAGGVTSGR